MSERVCEDPDCSFALTGVCARSYPDPEECPQRMAAIARLGGGEQGKDEEREEEYEEDAAPSPAAVERAGTAVLAAPEEKPSLPRSGTLGLRDLDALMRERYVHLIGVIGLPNAGKTACVASLYLLLAHGALKGFRYADSKSLIALDEIARGARRWNEGNSPAQMTVHTELADDRQAGFLHLRLKRDDDGRKFDLVLPDLPGEWSRRLIANGDAVRFDFLLAAEVLWLMVNGRDFVHAETQQGAIHSTTNLIERLSEIIPEPRPRLILVASWRDEGDFPASALDRIVAFARPLGFDVELASIASFSDNDVVDPGAGLAELIELSITGPQAAFEPWPMATGSPRQHRAFLDFGREL